MSAQEQADPRPEPEPSGTRPIPFLGLVWSIAVIGFVLGFLGSDYLGRVVLGAGWLTTYPATIGLGTVLAVAVGITAHRLLPTTSSRLWLLVPPVVTVAGVSALLLGSIALQWLFGYPVLACDWALFEVKTCVGHDWSMLQDRKGYAYAEGRVAPETCRAFQAQVPETPKSPVLPSGIECPADDPTFWQRASCSSLGQPGMSDCFVCAGISATADTYSHAQGFDRSCERAFKFFGKNTHPRDAARCSTSTRRENCPTGSIEETGPAIQQ